MTQITTVKRTYNGLLMSAGSNANLSDSTTPLITNWCAPLCGQIEDIILDQSAVMALSLFPRAAMARSKRPGLALAPKAIYPAVWLA